MCLVWWGEWAMQDHGPDIGVGKGHGYLILEKLGENFIFKGRFLTKKHTIGITILKWHWMDLEIFQVQKIFRPMYFYTILEDFTF